MTLRAPDVSMSLLVGFVAPSKRDRSPAPRARWDFAPQLVSRAIARLKPCWASRCSSARRGSSASRLRLSATTPTFAPRSSRRRTPRRTRARARGGARARALERSEHVGLARAAAFAFAARSAARNRVHVQVGNDVVDFHRQGFDMAVRLGRIEDASLVARKLGVGVVGLFASPDYLAKHGPPRSLEDLARHTLLPFVLPRSGRTLPWDIFANPDEEMVPRSAVRVRVDDPQGAIALARGHVGITELSLHGRPRNR